MGIQQIDGKSHRFVFLDLYGISSSHVFGLWKDIGQKQGGVELQETEQVFRLGVEGTTADRDIGSRWV